MLQDVPATPQAVGNQGKRMGGAKHGHLEGVPAGAQIQTSEQGSCWASAGSLHLETGSPVSQRLILHMSEKLKMESDVAWGKARTRERDRTQSPRRGKAKPLALLPSLWTSALPVGRVCQAPAGKVATWLRAPSITKQGTQGEVWG